MQHFKLDVHGCSNVLKHILCGSPRLKLLSLQGVAELEASLDHIKVHNPKIEWSTEEAHRVPSGSRTPNSHCAGDIPILAVQYVGRREYQHVRNELSKDVSIVLHDMVGMAASKIFGGQPVIFLDKLWFVTKCFASGNLTTLISLNHGVYQHKTGM